MMRGALIGCGYASWFHLTAWSRINNVQIVALSSRNPDAVRKRAHEFGIPRTYTDYTEMLEKEDLDFVDIATPPPAHREMVSAAATRGIHVLCQKPIAPTLCELDQMIEICSENGVRFMVNENCRFQPWFRHMRQQIDAGAIGTPFYVGFQTRARLSMTEPVFEDQPFFRDMPRLAVYELGVHYLDTFRYLAGEPSTLHCSIARISPEIAGEDRALLTVHRDGVDGLVDLSWVSVPAADRPASVSWGEFLVEGTKGTMHVDHGGVFTLRTDAGATESVTFPAESEMLGYAGAQQHFVEALLRGDAFETSGSETRKTMELVFGSYLSARTHEVYRVGDDLHKLEAEERES